MCAGRNWQPRWPRLNALRWMLTHVSYWWPLNFFSYWRHYRWQTDRIYRRKHVD